MGAKLVTIPYDESTKRTENLSTQQNEAQKISQSNSNDFHRQNAHAFMNIDPSSIPSECPMHQAKSKQNETSKKPDETSCPIKGATNDINPFNMVLVLKHLIITQFLYNLFLFIKDASTQSTSISRSAFSIVD